MARKPKDDPVTTTAECDLQVWREFFLEFNALSRHWQAHSRHDAPLPEQVYFDFFHNFNADYTRFKESGGTINVWEVAGLGVDEVRNCAVLGWLLDCHGSHGQGNAFLRCFLEAVDMDSLTAACRERFPRVEHLHASYQTIAESAYTQAVDDGVIANNRVDIVIESASFLLFIEAKVHAGETGDQLKRYTDILHARAGERSHAIIFLTPDGRDAQDEKIVNVACLSWQQLAASFEKHLATADIPTSSPLWTAPVHQFCHHIRTF